MSCGCLAGAMGKFMSKSAGSNAAYGVGYEEHQDQSAGQSPVTEFKQYSRCHEEAVMSVAAVEPGVSLSGSKDKTVVVFNHTTGRTCQRWTSHEKEVTKVVYGKQIKSYFSASRDKSVCMWQDGQPGPVLSFRGHDLVVTAVTLNEENTQLCTGSRDNWLKLWDLQTGSCVLQNCVSRNLITHAKWGHDSNLIAQTGEDKEVRIWDANSLQVIQSFPRKQHIQTCCDLSQDMNYCLTSSNGFQGNGCEATLWDLRTTRPMHEFKGHTETVEACCFLPTKTGEGNLLATSSNDCSVRIWDQDSAECVAVMSLAGSGPLTSIAPYDDGSLSVASFNSGVYLLVLAQTSGAPCLTLKAQF